MLRFYFCLPCGLEISILKRASFLEWHFVEFNIISTYCRERRGNKRSEPCWSHHEPKSALFLYISVSFHTYHFLKIFHQTIQLRNHEQKNEISYINISLNQTKFSEAGTSSILPRKWSIVCIRMPQLVYAIRVIERIRQHITVCCGDLLKVLRHFFSIFQEIKTSTQCSKYR